MEDGEDQQVQAEDPAFRDDIEAWAEMTGNQLLSIEEGETTTTDLKRRL